MDSFVSSEGLFTTVLGYLAAGTTFYEKYPDGQLCNVGSQGAIDSYLCLRCASKRLCRIVTGPPLLDALEFAISHGECADDCQRYQSIVDSGWLNQVYPNASLARAVVGDVTSWPLQYGDVLFYHQPVPLGMHRRFFMEYCSPLTNGSPARLEIGFEDGAARSYALVFGKYLGHNSEHFARWNPHGWIHFQNLD